MISYCFWRKRRRRRRRRRRRWFLFPAERTFPPHFPPWQNLERRRKAACTVSIIRQGGEGKGGGKIPFEVFFSKTGCLKKNHPKTTFDHV